MRNLFLFFLITLLTGSPVIALLVILALYLVLDYQFIGISRKLFGRFRTAAAIRTVLREISINPDDAVARRDLGRLLVQVRRFQEAVPHLERAAARMPDSDEAACDLGLSYLWTGKLPEGEALIRKALERSPKLRYGEPHLRWGEFLLHQGRAEQAAERLERFRAIFSSSVEGHYLLGKAYLRSGERDKAVTAFRAALEMFKRSPGYKRREERLWAWKTRARLLMIG
jgi:tetratricopeptide (TPR) repeat protein